jgi:hypothetical protein
MYLKRTLRFPTYAGWFARIKNTFTASKHFKVDNFIADRRAQLVGQPERSYLEFLA